MSQSLAVLSEALERAKNYRLTLDERGCAPRKTYAEMTRVFDEPLPTDGSEGAGVIRELSERGDAGLMQMAHPRFFGWVLGASHPVGVAADWLASAWGQNTGYHTPTPTTAAVESVAASWLLELLDLPRESSVGFVTGATVGNFVALAAARGRTLRAHDWDPDADGLFGAPEIHVFIGDDAHTSVFSALQYLGLGHDRVIRIDADSQGAIRSDHLAREVGSKTGPKIIIGQAGQINTGAFDPFQDMVEIAKESEAWLHIDGAFGLWARANPGLKPQTTGIDGADSWVTDGHKWLQTPFDSGYAIVRDADAHHRAMTTWASYLPVQESGDRIPSMLTPELSRRARGLATWAMIKTLGKSGVADMIGRHCAVATHMADRLAGTPGVRLLNRVNLNQIIVEFGDDPNDLEDCKVQTQAVIDAAVASGRLFVGGARWRDRWVMRISVIAFPTTIDDGDEAVDAIVDAWRSVRDPRTASVTQTV